MACASLQEDPTVEEQEGLENLDPDQFASIAGSDTCPACNTEIAFDNSRIAKCDAGHVWGAFFFFPFSMPNYFVKLETKKMLICFNNRTMLDYTFVDTSD
jgi:hypothetical protein